MASLIAAEDVVVAESAGEVESTGRLGGLGVGAEIRARDRFSSSPGDTSWAAAVPPRPARANAARIGRRDLVFAEVLKFDTWDTPGLDQTSTPDPAVSLRRE
jgi:hypothetical protein